MHGDLGPDNLLLHDDLPIIGDLGSARRIVACADYVPPAVPAWIRGELHWPPEYSDDSRDSRPTVDLYGLGCSTVFAVTGRYPRYGADLADQVPPTWAPLLTALVEHDPVRRPQSAREARRFMKKCGE
jgi:serine/threonine protein kinase